MFKKASVANIIAYEGVLIPLSFILSVVYSGRVEMLWISIIAAYAAVNVGYYVLIWGWNGKDDRFTKKSNILQD